ncbi:hypothetical protein OCOJLMKI_5118 [Methylobacterium iners]|uniref:Uncharacterized protein n=1 Tax=Methylobacterium iners TaxID=418707 RepID=A0ABQ4S5V2_9HYPH|nr:hypothetical protein OCOJLMKI_5118 [Methylobacterium iners]
MKSALSFTATPTIQPRIVAPSSAPVGSTGSTPRPTAAAARTPAPAGGGDNPRVQSAALRRSGGVNINGPVHVHGVTDVASLQRGLSREADRKARDARDNGLHDLGSYA